MWLVLALAGCVPLPPPAPAPRATLGPRMPEAWGLEAAPAAPAAPVLLTAPHTALINSQQAIGGLWRADVLLRWSHPSPPGTNWYRVYAAVDEPYFDPATCATCELEGETTALRWVSAAPGLAFYPDNWDAEANLMSRMQTYRVVACNRGGCSAVSNEVGVVSYSLNQGIPNLPSWAP